MRDIVKQVDTQAPFLQTVQLGNGGAPPTLETHGVVESVVAAPEVSQRLGRGQVLTAHCSSATHDGDWKDQGPAGSGMVWASHLQGLTAEGLQNWLPTAAATPAHPEAPAGTLPAHPDQPSSLSWSVPCLQLWQGIAEHVSQSSPDVVILVQRVSPHAADSPQGAMEAAQAEQLERQQQRQQQQQEEGARASGSGSGCASSSPPGSPRSPRAQRSPPAEEACRRLVDSGLADAVLLGQVGDCCDGSGHGHGDSGGGSVAEPRQAGQAATSRQLLPAIVPFGPGSGSSSAARRTAVRAAALRPPGAPASGAGACQHSACFWGVVVQAPEHTGVAGCYLLKTVKNTTPSTGCTCTHFSLTRISSGEHLEQQFVQSWLL